MCQWYALGTLQKKFNQEDLFENRQIEFRWNQTRYQDILLGLRTTRPFLLLQLLLFEQQLFNNITIKNYLF